MDSWPTETRPGWGCGERCWVYSLARAKGHHDSRLASRFTITMARFGTIHDSPGVTIHDDQNNFTIHDPDLIWLTIACLTFHDHDRKATIHGPDCSKPSYPYQN